MTLAKYGLSEGEWKYLLKSQGGGCGVCERTAEALPTPKRGGAPFLAIDHEHVRGWKIMSPELRKLHVRGLCCTRCNHFILTRYGTPALHRAAAEYLERHSRRHAS
jgi:hypothetical protein